MNNTIRRTIIRYIKHYGHQDTRKMIKSFSLQFNTSKQRISGNISHLKRTGRINIIPNAPHSIMY